ncbi:hypothetical protein G6F63_015931 [Rhizopus arrhizus]|nr:hypothetical protein G6F63_015931 [Rhizopus arrhizus]
MPPLRERGADVLLLAEHFLRCFRRRHTVRARGFSPTASQAMRRFGWPGNVRELRNVIQRAQLLATGSRIEVADLNLPRTAAAPRPAPEPEAQFQPALSAGADR